MSKEAQGLLPTLTVSNRVGEMAITGEAELVVKDPSTYGFSWCKTEQLTGTVMHQYHLHAFPFDVHEVALRLPRSLALSRALSRSLTLSHAHSSIRRCSPCPRPHSCPHRPALPKEILKDAARAPSHSRHALAPACNYQLQVETAVKKAADIKRWFLEISDNGFSDADEAIPYYATEDNRAHLPGDWRKHGREQMLSPLEFESGMLYEGQSTSQ